MLQLNITFSLALPRDAARYSSTNQESYYGNTPPPPNPCACFGKAGTRVGRGINRVLIAAGEGSATQIFQSSGWFDRLTPSTGRKQLTVSLPNLSKEGL